ncbi:MAG: hypothetical protein EPN93_07770 [Spirochaetes bacterium]|nr:MAG: hypothetical protein EPN93_07770 [Spirochaetota bacterium]
MKVRTLIVAVTAASIALFVSCAGYDSSGYGSSTCDYTVSGDYSAMYSGNPSMMMGAPDNFTCSGAYGYGGGYPSVSLDLNNYTVPGTYNLNGTDGTMVFTYSSGVTYTSDGTTLNCTIMFTSDSMATFACDNIPEDGAGTGTVSISGGMFSF